MTHLFKHSFKQWVAVGMLTPLMFTTACKKDDFSKQPDKITTAAEEFKTALINTTNAVDKFNDAESDLFRQAAFVPDGAQTVASESANVLEQPVAVTYVPDYYTYPHTQIVNYHNGWTDKFGVVRKGKVFNYFTAPVLTVGSVQTTTFQNYFYNGAKFLGTRTSERLNTKVIAWRIVYDSWQQNYPNGDAIKAYEIRVRQQSGGTNTPNDALDDVFRVTGGGNGNEYFGGKLAKFQDLIDHDNPLTYLYTCQDAVAGIQNTQILFPKPPSSDPNPPIYDNIVLNYGTGACDGVATITYGGSPHTVSLPITIWPFN